MRVSNRVTIVGVIDSEFTYNHEVFGEGFYMVDVVIERLSHTEDTIPMMVSERLVDVSKVYKGKKVEVVGQIRTFNKHEGEKSHLAISVFAREFSFVEEDDNVDFSNHVFLDGYICKQPAYRTTPKGREISDLLLAVNRPYGKSDYIPCICWSRNARFAGKLEIGTNIQVCGRIQSRTYKKRLENDQIDERTAYEVSVSKIEVLNNAEMS